MSTNEKNITRGGEFIIKETDCENIFSPEDFSEEQLMMKQAVSDFIDKEVMPHRERFENKDYKLTEDTMKKAGDLGFLGVAVPEEYGGMGMGFVSTMLVCETISGDCRFFINSIWSTYWNWYNANSSLWKSRTK